MEQSSPDETEKGVNCFSRGILPSSIKQLHKE